MPLSVVRGATLACSRSTRSRALPVVLTVVLTLPTLPTGRGQQGEPLSRRPLRRLQKQPLPLGTRVWQVIYYEMQVINEMRKGLL